MVVEVSFSGWGAAPTWVKAEANQIGAGAGDSEQ